MRAEALLLFDHDLDLGGAPGIAGGIGELHAIVGEHRVDFVGHGFDQRSEEIRRDSRGGASVELHKSEFARPINGDKEMELALGGLNFGDVDMKIADRIGFEFLPGGLVAFNLRQAGDAMALQASVQRRT